MARDEPHYLYMKAWDIKSNKEKWNVNIINNGAAPTEKTTLDQMNFNNEFGTTVMYDPHNGRLAYARDHIFVVFAHYNYFGLTDSGGRNSHTGDSAAFVHAETGIKTGHPHSWDTSHSLL